MKLLLSLIFLISQTSFAGVQVIGSVTGVGADVDTNKQLKIALPSTIANSGFAGIATEYDSGVISGAKNFRKARTADGGHLSIGIDTPIFNEYFDGAAINSALWNSPVTTATIVQGTGFLALNSAGSLASGAVARVTSYRGFSVYGQVPLIVKMTLQFGQLAQTNNITEFGLGIATGTTAPTDGMFFRILANGEFRAIINNNGTETQSSSINFTTLVGAGVTKSFFIYVYENVVEYYIDKDLAFSVPRPTAAGAISASQVLPILFRTYNTGVTAAGQILKVGAVSVFQGAMDTGKTFPQIASGAGAHSGQGQTGGTMGSTALYTNSLGAGAGAVMTNTTAALGSGLGGQFSALPTLAVGTDGIVSSYQVPLGTAALPGKQLCITDISIQGAVTTILTGGPVLYAYSLAYGHNTVSLASAESSSAGTKAPRRLALGLENYIVTAPVGTIGTGIKQILQTPVCVQQGEFVQVVAKNMGVVTTTGVITFEILLNGYWE